MLRVVRLILWFVVGVLIGIVFFSSGASAQTATQTYAATGTCNGFYKEPAQSGPYPGIQQTCINTQIADYDDWAHDNGGSVTTTFCSASWSQGTPDLFLSFSYSGLINYSCAQKYTQREVAFTCPQGGVLNTTTYAGYCIVNGQPPAVGPATPAACQAFASSIEGQLIPYQYSDSVPGDLPMSSLPVAGSPAVYDPTDVSGNDPYAGCGLVEVGPRVSPPVDGHPETTVFYKASGSVGTGLPSSVATSPSASPAVVQCDGANFCLNGSEILAQPGTAATDSQATINGQPISVPSSIPDGSCVSLTSGGVFCAADAVQPNNGASPPAPATPDDTVTTTGAGGSSTVDNYYSSTTVEQSTNYGNGKSSTSGGSTTTTTCTTSGSTQTCTSATSATTAKSATTYPTPVFPGGTSVNASIGSAADAIKSSPLVTAAAGAIAQSVPAGACPDWTFHSVLFNQTFDFSNGQAGICTFAAAYGPTLTVVFAVMWVVLGAIIILSA